MVNYAGPGDRVVGEAGGDGEHGVVVLGLPTMLGNLQEELHQLHPLAQVRFAHHLKYMLTFTCSIS